MWENAATLTIAKLPDGLFLMILVRRIAATGTHKQLSKECQLDCTQSRGTVHHFVALLPAANGGAIATVIL